MMVNEGSAKDAAMKAYVYRRFGSPDVLEAAEMPAPEISSDQVLIEVRATSINPLDYRLRQGEIPGFAPAFPAIPHADVSGVVREAGRNVRHLKPGDDVYACAGGVRGRQGALAELMAADAELVSLKPETLSFEQAAALPLVSIAAYEALIDTEVLESRNDTPKRVLIFG